MMHEVLFLRSENSILGEAKAGGPKPTRVVLGRLLKIGGGQDFLAEKDADKQLEQDIYRNALSQFI